MAYIVVIRKHMLGLSLLWVAILGLVYPLFAAQTRQPLAVFVLPILVASALGTWQTVAMVGAAATAVATTEGALQSALDGGDLAARLVVVVAAWLAGVVIAHQRTLYEAFLIATRERAVLSEVFQTSLAPVPAPPDGFTVTVRFQPGDERFSLGGDFFDALRLPNGHLGYIIGDVCGHGPRAAALGAAVRTGWKTIAMHEPSDPAQWLHALDRAFFSHDRHDTFVTVNTGTLEPDGDRLCFASAGHPWPIVIGDQPVVLQPDVGPPLGVRKAGRWARTDARLPAGATLLLYTDGLTENPAGDGANRLFGDERLLRYLRSSPAASADDVLAHFGPGFDDDVAIMTIRRT